MCSSLPGSAMKPIAPLGGGGGRFGLNGGAWPWLLPLSPPPELFRRLGLPLGAWELRLMPCILSPLYARMGDLFLPLGMSPRAMRGTVDAWVALTCGEENGTPSSSKLSSSSESESSSEDEEVEAAKKVTLDPDKENEEMCQLVGDNNIVAHLTRGTLHLIATDELANAKCGEDVLKWPTVLYISTKDASEKEYPLCNRPACFQCIVGYDERKSASQMRSGNPVLGYNRLQTVRSRTGYRG